MLAFFKVILYNPLLNILALLVAVVPGGDVGIAIILLTLLVKIVLYPLSQRAMESQVKVNELTPELNKIKNSGLSKEEQAKKTFELYRTNKVNPLSGCLTQLPVIFIIIALYSVFASGLNFESDVLYSFIPVPSHINMNFLGIVDLTQKSLVLALIAAISQYFQAHYMPKPKESSGAPGSFQESFSKSMHMQMKYFFPILIFLILYTDFVGAGSARAAIALYFITSNIFAIGQQIYAQRKAQTA